MARYYCPVNKVNHMEQLSKQADTTIGCLHNVDSYVYLVTQGDYSDYHICGAYSTMELAEQAALAYGPETNIEEHVLDVMPALPHGMYVFVVTMGRDGDTHSVFRMDSTLPGDYYQIEWGEQRHPCGHWRPSRPKGDNIDFTMFARDETHAIKIANERRAQLIAMDSWVTDWETYSTLWRLIAEKFREKGDGGHQ